MQLLLSLILNRISLLRHTRSHRPVDTELLPVSKSLSLFQRLHPGFHFELSIQLVSFSIRATANTHRLFNICNTTIGMNTAFVSAGLISNIVKMYKQTQMAIHAALNLFQSNDLRQHISAPLYNLTCFQEYSDLLIVTYHIEGLGDLTIFYLLYIYIYIWSSKYSLTK